MYMVFDGLCKDAGHYIVGGHLVCEELENAVRAKEQLVYGLNFGGVSAPLKT